VLLESYNKNISKVTITPDHAIKACMGVDVPLHLFRTLAQVVNIRPRPLYRPERTLVPTEKETGEP